MSVRKRLVPIALCGVVGALTAAAPAAHASPEVDVAARAQVKIVGLKTPITDGGPGAVSAGDINGDGRDDLWVSDGTDTGFFAWEGSTYVIYGAATPAVIDVRQLGDRGFKVDLGTATATPVFPADINGDGLSDAVTYSRDRQLIVAYTSRSGRYDVASRGFRLSGVTFGGAADLTGDGVPELLARTPGFLDVEGGAPGLVLVPGAANRTGAFTSDQLRAEGRTLPAPARLGETNVGLHPVGDLNGDGTGDAAFAVWPYDDDTTLPGYVSAFFAGPTTKLTAVDPAAPGARGFRVEHLVNVDGGGDINGDGKQDLVGEVESEERTAENQRTAVVFGSASTATVQARTPGARGLTFRAGWPTPTGDQTGDGKADLLLDGDANRSFLIFGRASGVPAIMFDEWTPTGIAAGDGLALGRVGAESALGPAGDVTGDRVRDFYWTVGEADGTSSIRVAPGGFDTVAPVLTARLTNTVFRIGAQPWWVPKGSTLKVSLTERASVQVVVRDVLKRPVAAQVFADANAGSADLPFSGTVGGKRLGPGVYTATATPRDKTGNVGTTRKVTFTIVG